MLRFVARKTAGVFHEIGKGGFSGKGILLSMAYETIGDCFMPPQKEIPCFLMVEVFDIPIHQFRIIALMFHVTDGTIFGFIPVESTVG
jgi:hypothetical protein